MEPAVLTSPSTLVSATENIHAEPRSHSGSAELSNAFALTRGEPISSSIVTASLRSPPLRMSLPPKMSGRGTVHKPSPFSSTRKPLPKQSAPEDQDTSSDNDLDGKLGKINLKDGPTMVRN